MPRGEHPRERPLKPDDLLRQEPRKRVPCLLKSEAVENWRRIRGIERPELARLLGIDKRTLEFWLARDPRRRPDIEDAQCLAQVLGVGLEEICILCEGDHADEERRLAEGGMRALSSPRGKVAMLSTFIHHASKFLSYARHISLRFWPLRGYVRRFFSDGEIRHTYATVRIRPSRHVREASFIFSFCLGPVRVDYGAVELRYGAIIVHPFFALYGGSADVDQEGAFLVRTWFGPEPCHFVVRCTECDFELELLEVKSGDRDHERPGAVTFIAAPHHLLAIEPR